MSRSYELLPPVDSPLTNSLIGSTPNELVFITKQGLGTSNRLTFQNGLNVKGYGLFKGYTTTPGYIGLYDSPSNSSYSVSLYATGLTNSYAIYFPTSQGQANQVLTNDGSGNLSWANLASELGSGATNYLTYWQSPTTLSYLPLLYNEAATSLIFYGQNASGNVTIGNTNTIDSSIFLGSAGSLYFKTATLATSGETRLTTSNSTNSNLSIWLSSGGVTNQQFYLDYKGYLGLGTLPTAKLHLGTGTIKLDSFSGNYVLVSDASGQIQESSITNTILNFLNTTTGNVQTQLDNKQANSTHLTSISNLSGAGVVVHNGSGNYSTQSSLIESLGGTNQTSYLPGDILYADSDGDLQKLAIGAAGQILKTNGTNPYWSSTGAAVSGTLLGSGTIGYVPHFSAGDELSNSSIYYNSVNGHIAIGTTTTSSGTFTVGAINSSNKSIFLGSAGNTWGKLETVASLGELKLTVGNASTGNTYLTLHTANAGAETEWARLTSLGYLGLNKTSPGDRLHLGTGSVRIDAFSGNKVVISNANKSLSESAVTSAELSYVAGVTGLIQTQLNSKQAADNTLTALAALNTTPGFVTQTGTDTFSKVTLTGTANQISITNTTGTGNPVFSLPVPVILSNSGFSDSRTMSLTYAGTYTSTASYVPRPLDLIHTTSVSGVNTTVSRWGARSQFAGYVTSGNTDSGYFIGYLSDAKINTASHQGTLTSTYGSWNEVGFSSLGSGGTVSTAIGSRIQLSLSGSGTIGTFYGLYVSQAGTSTTISGSRYGIYETLSSGALNYFANNVGIGTTNPVQPLHVVGTGRFSAIAGSGTGIVIANANGDLAVTRGTGLLYSDGTFIASGTFAAASHNHNSSYLQIVNDLNDLNDANLARNNLGLGTAAQVASSSFALSARTLQITGGTGLTITSSSAVDLTADRTWGLNLSSNLQAYSSLATGTFATSGHTHSSMVTGTGTNGIIAKFTGTSSVGDSILTDTTTGVTINGDFLPTTNQTRDLGSSALSFRTAYLRGLEVTNTAYSQINISATQVSGAAVLNFSKWNGTSQVTPAWIALESDGTTDTGKLLFGTLSNGAGFYANLVSARMVITNSGANSRVGIGTTTPSYELDVSGAIRATNLSGVSTGVVVTDANGQLLQLRSSDLVLGTGSTLATGIFAASGHNHDSTYLIKASNLSDLTSVTTARNNLELGTSDNPTFAGLALVGNADFNTKTTWFATTAGATAGFYLGKIRAGSGVDGGIHGTVQFSYDFGTSTISNNIHFAFAQRSGTARGHWWYEHTGLDSTEIDKVSVRLINTGGLGTDYEVWLMLGDYAKVVVDAYTRHGSGWQDPGQLASGTVTSGTTLYDTRNSPTSQHTFGGLTLAQASGSTTAFTTVSSAGVLGRATMGTAAQFWDGTGTLVSTGLFAASGHNHDSTYLQIANNLSDLNSVSTARTNLELGTTASPTFKSIIALDTTSINASQAVSGYATGISMGSNTTGSSGYPNTVGSYLTLQATSRFTQLYWANAANSAFYWRNNVSSSYSNWNIALSATGSLTANRVLLSSTTAGFVVASSVTNTELGYLSGVTSAIQTQLNSKLATGAVINALAGLDSSTGFLVQTGTSSFTKLATGTFAGSGHTHADLTPNSRTLQITGGTGLTVTSSAAVDLSSNRTWGITLSSNLQAYSQLATGIFSASGHNHDSTYLLKASNLSDLTNIATARTNLGLGTAAQLASGTLSQAAMASKLNSIFSADTRAVNDAPSGFNRGLYADFKQNTTNGLSDSGTYNGVLTFRSYGTSGDFSGGPAFQLGFTYNGNIFKRYGGAGTPGSGWSSWVKVYDESNLTTAVVTGLASGSFALASHTHAASSITSGTFDNTRISSGSVTQHEALINHDNLSGFVGNEHIDHSGVSITAGTGLSGGGDLTTSRTLNLANTAVSSGTYGSSTQVPQFTVDAQGRLTSATNVSITASGLAAVTGSGASNYLALWNTSGSLDYDTQFATRGTTTKTLVVGPGASGIVLMGYTSSGSTFTPAVVAGSNVLTNPVGFVAGFVDGTKNPRASFYVDPTASKWGLNYTYSSAADYKFSISAGSIELTNWSTTNLSFFRPILATSGTVTAPGISFVGDTNTGLYQLDADDIGIATNGTLRARFNSSGLLLPGAARSTLKKALVATDGTIHTNSIGEYGGGVLEYVSSNVVATSGTWYRIAYNGTVASGGTDGARASGRFKVYEYQGSRHQVLDFSVTCNYSTNPVIVLHSQSTHAQFPIKGIRVVNGSTYEGQAVEIYCAESCIFGFVLTNNDYSNYSSSSGWTPQYPATGSIPAGMTALTWDWSAITDWNFMPIVGMKSEDGEWYIAHNGKHYNSSLTASRALSTDASGFLKSSSTTNTELGYLSGVTGAVQTQLNSKLASGSVINALALLNSDIGLVYQSGASSFTKLSTGIFSVSGHTHAISDVIGLQTALDSKVASSLTLQITGGTGLTVTSSGAQTLASNRTWGLNLSSNLQAYSSLATGTFATSGHTHTSMVTGAGVSGRVAVFNSTNSITSGLATTTELSYLSGVTSNIQTQIGTKLTAGNNLSDLTSAANARNNLGLGTAAQVASGAFAGSGLTASLTASSIPYWNGTALANSHLKHQTNIVELIKPCKIYTGSTTWAHYSQVVEYVNSSSVTGAFVINTPISRTSNEMFRITVRGFTYGNANPIVLTAVGYAYGGSTGDDGQLGNITNPGLVDTSGIKQEIRLGINASGNVALVIGSTGTVTYYQRFVVDCDSTRYGNLDYSSGWSVTTTTSGNYGLLDNTGVIKSNIGGQLYFDPTNTRIGIGTSSPSQTLDVVGSIEHTAGLFSSDGSAAAPSLTFTADTDTGIYRLGTNSVGFAASGTTIFRYDTNGVGVGGSTSATYLLNINKTLNNVSGAGLYSVVAGTMTTTAYNLNIGGYFGTAVNINTTGSCNNVGIYITNQNTYVSSGITAVGTQYGALIYGDINTPNHRGLLSTQYGTYIQHGLSGSSTGSGSITNSYGLRIATALTGTGTVGSYYQLYLGKSGTTTTISGNRWAVYQGDTDANNYFAGSMIFSATNHTGNTVAYFDSNRYLKSSSVTPTELGYLTGVTSAIQTQLNSKLASGAVINALAGLDSSTGLVLQTGTSSFTKLATGAFATSGHTHADLVVNTRTLQITGSTGLTVTSSAALDLSSNRTWGLALSSNLQAYSQLATGTFATSGHNHNSQYLQIANNLSDIASASVARTNLALGTSDSPNFLNLSLGSGTAQASTNITIQDSYTGNYDGINTLGKITFKNNANNNVGVAAEIAAGRGRNVLRSGLLVFRTAPSSGILNDVAAFSQDGNLLLGDSTFIQGTNGIARLQVRSSSALVSLENASGTVRFSVANAGTVLINAGLSQNLPLSLNASNQLVAETAATTRTNLGLGTAAQLASGSFATSGHTHTNMVTGIGVSGRVAVFNGTNSVTSGLATTTELSYLSGVTSNIQTQIGNKLTAGNNLNDLTSTTNARNNLGLGTAARLASGAFATSGHTHAISGVTGLQTTLDSKVASSLTLQITGNGITVTSSGAQSLAANRVWGLSFTNTGVSSGTYGNATTIPQVTIGADGRVTSATGIAVDIVSDYDDLTNKPTSFSSIPVTGANRYENFSFVWPVSMTTLVPGLSRPVTWLEVPYNPHDSSTESFAIERFSAMVWAAGSDPATSVIKLQVSSNPVTGFTDVASSTLTFTSTGATAYPFQATTSIPTTVNSGQWLAVYIVSSTDLDSSGYGSEHIDLRTFVMLRAT